MNNIPIIKKRTLIGTVVSDAMQKTRVVEIERMARHGRYHARYTVTTRYKAHDEQSAYHVGDTVIIQETRPLSRDKRWEIVELIKKGEERAVHANDNDEDKIIEAE